MTPPMDPASLQNLRSMVHDCLAKHLYDSAIFFADKLACFTDNAPIEVYNLANAFFVARQHRRCLHLLRTSGLVDKDVRFRYLGARCLAEIKEYEDCLEMLGGVDVLRPEELIESLAVPPSTPGASLDYLAAVFLLRGQVYDALENFPRAVQWYRAALARDPFCHGAFAALIDRHRLRAGEEAALVDELQAAIPEDQRWLGLLYRARCKAYNVNAQAAAVTALEGDPPDAAGPAGAGAGTPGAGGQQHSMHSTPSTGDASMSGVTPPPSGLRPGARRASSASAMAISPISEGSQEGTGGRSSGAGGRPPRRPSSASSPPAQQPHGQGRGQPAPPPGHGDHEFGLFRCAEVTAAGAELLVRTGQYALAYSATGHVLERDPFAEVVLPAHLAAAVAIGSRHELFSLGHRLMAAAPERASSWYAAGCFYFCTKQYASARHYFAKATSLDRRYAPAWLGFAQCFAAQDETDQAMAAFRTAARLFPGLHVPLVGMGLEYARMNNGALAEQTLLRAHRRCPADPVVLHELGTLLYRQGRHEEALDWLTKALDRAPRCHPSLWEPTLVNLGHALRKLKRYDEAIDMFQRALAANGDAPGTYAAMGLVHQLRGEAGRAVECYHAALGLAPQDDLVAGLLAGAVAEESEAMTAELARGMQLS